MRAHILADNRLAENAGWDKELLAIEFPALIDVGMLGFSLAEIDLTIGGIGSPNEADPVLDRVEPVATGPAITKPGVLWLLGPHRLLFGDARSVEDVAKVCGGAEAALLFADPPYNVPIDGHVSGLDKVKHREFAVASGEMDEAVFTAFLTDSAKTAASKLKEGAMACC